MDLPKKIRSIDKKTSSSSRKMQKSSSNTIEAPPSQPPKTRLTAGESIKNAVDLYFKNHDLHTPRVSQSKIRTTNVTKKKSIPKTQSKERQESRTELQSASSKSLRKGSKIRAVESRSNASRVRLQSATSKNLRKTDEAENDVQPIEPKINESNIVPVESQQSNVTEIESIAEENELLLDLASLINGAHEIYPFEPNLPTPRSLGSFLNFVGPPHPEDNAEAAQENRLDPPNLTVNSSTVVHTATQMYSSLTQSRNSAIDNFATINQEHVIQQLQPNQQSGSSDALSKSSSQGFSAKNQTDGDHCPSTNVNNGVRSTQNTMHSCSSSFTYSSSNTIVALYVANAMSPYVEPLVQQQV